MEDLRSGIFDGGSDGFLIYVPSAHSKSMAPEGKHSVTIYTVAPNVLKKGSWEKDIEKLAEKLIQHAEEYIPGLSGHIVEKVVMTPLEFKKLTHLKHHGFGGISPIMGKTNPPHITPVKNFYFIGAQSESGGGVGGAMNGACKTAKKVLEESEKSKGENR